MQKWIGFINHGKSVASLFRWYWTMARTFCPTNVWFGVAITVTIPCNVSCISCNDIFSTRHEEHFSSIKISIFYQCDNATQNICIRRIWMNGCIYVNSTKSISNIYKQCHFGTNGKETKQKKKTGFLFLRNTSKWNFSCSGSAVWWYECEISWFCAIGQCRTWSASYSI